VVRSSLNGAKPCDGTLTALLRTNIDSVNFEMSRGSKRSLHPCIRRGAANMLLSTNRASTDRSTPSKASVSSDNSERQKRSTSGTSWSTSTMGVRYLD
ncbi:MAG: hypothetical protein ABJ364_07900, partial [Lentilitoribacter sp.]